MKTIVTVGVFVYECPKNVLICVPENKTSRYGIEEVPR
jgi:hypothetical protein